MFSKDAQCRDASVEDFQRAFGDSEDADEPFNDEDAEYFGNKFCSVCPVMLACKADATKWKEQYGVRGWETASERSARINP